MGLRCCQPPGAPAKLDRGSTRLDSTPLHSTPFNSAFSHCNSARYHILTDLNPFPRIPLRERSQHSLISSDIMFGALSRHALSTSALRRSTASSRQLHSSAQAYALSKFSMPAMSPTMTEGGIASWKKKEGESFAVGDVLLEIETDKATMDVEAQDEGKIAKIIMADGSKAVPVGKAIAIFAEEGDEVSSGELEKLIAESEASAAPPPKESTESKPSTPEPARETSKSSSASSSSTPPPSKHSSPSAPRDAIFATPSAKRIALEKGIPLASIKGSGPNGRILESDLSSYSKAGGASVSSSSSSSSGAAYEDLPVSNMRRTIANRLGASKRDVPHYYLTSEIQMDRVIRLRALFNKAAEERAASSKAGGLKAPTKLSVNDFVIKASALACADVPEVNSSWQEDFVRQNHHVDISVAVATPTGLITPIVTNVGSRGLGSISAEIKALATKAKNNQLAPHEYQGGTFTVSNLGMFGSVSHFTAIINSPQSCILAVGGAEKILAIDDDPTGKGFKEVEVMKVTLSCDHRVVDGAVGARWLKAFKGYMENPLSFML
ncbi:hypothetical protein PCANC_17753 [Puccinia coronata f. sp. avenae]|uniref:Acetyltransferase component of pyruvate dehydrogenase complex n=1 Tax=Puccinia coronata f. sp. avenae TaxID=200324 RepID=A0A2N5UYU4_9BASI|nr:hypothetical protein PCANC_17753 [Puccinia coronata f. sp. avenae]